MTEGIRADVETALLPRFADRLQRVEVYLRDTNSHKGGIDKRCSIEARLAGYPAVAVEGEAASVDLAVIGALDRLVHALEHRLGRLANRGGHASAAGVEKM